jgi:hypothetical protein
LAFVLQLDGRETWCLESSHRLDRLVYSAIHGKERHMSTTFFGASFDAADAARAAAFWAAVLDRRVADGPDEHDAVGEAGDPGSGTRLAFHQVPEAKSTKNRFHPDLINIV